MIGMSIGTFLRQYCGSGGGDPSEMSGTFCILDATDGSTLFEAADDEAEVGDSITLWLDKANGASPINFYSTSSLRYPTKGAGTVIYNNDHSRVQSGWPGNVSTEGLTVVGVIDAKAYVGSQVIFSGADPLDLECKIEADGDIFIYSGGTGFKVAEYLTNTGLETFIFILEFNGADSAQWWSSDDVSHGTSSATGECGTDTLTEINISEDGAGANRLRAAELRYIAFIDGVLTAGEKHNVGQWLQQNIDGLWRFHEGDMS